MSNKYTLTIQSTLYVVAISHTKSPAESATMTQFITHYQQSVVCNKYLNPLNYLICFYN